MATNFDKSLEPASFHESDVSQEESGSEQLENIEWNISEIIKNNSVLTSEKLEKLLLPWLKKAKESAIENEKNARIDPLTGLPNRRAFDESMKREISLFKRKEKDGQHELVAVRLDLDRFKNINDTYGHDIGDKYLKKIAEYVSNILRKSDIFARFGGDEFDILMPDVNPAHLKEIEERLLKAVEEGSNKAKEELRLEKPDVTFTDEDANITASVGLTKYNGMESAEDFFVRADVHVYIAKEMGRNQAIDDLEVEKIRREKASKGQ